MHSLLLLRYHGAKRMSNLGKEQRQLTWPAYVLVCGIDVSAPFHNLLRRNMKEKLPARNATFGNKEALRAFLAEHAWNTERARLAMELLEPFFRASFRFIPMPELQRDATLIAIAQGIRRPIHRIHPISIARPFPKSDWMSEDGFASTWTDKRSRATLGCALQFSVEPTVEIHLRANYLSRLGLPLATLETLNDVYLSTMPDVLREYFEFGDGGFVWTTFRTCVLFFLQAAMCSDDLAFQQLASFVRLLHSALPLGEKRGEPGTWLVLTE